MSFIVMGLDGPQGFTGILGYEIFDLDLSDSVLPGEVQDDPAEERGEGSPPCSGMHELASSRALPS